MDNPRRNRDLRIGTPERDRAMVLLGEHMGSGRLEITEYEQRCAQAAAARYRSEITPLFRDLPAPHPEFQPTPAANGRFAAKPVAIGVGVSALVVLVAVAAKQMWLLALLAVVLVVLARRRRA